MHPEPAPEPAPAGWTRERRVRFLRRLAESGNVHAACAEVGLSRQSVYKLRRRDPQFAQIWKAALEAAREARVRRLLARLGADPAGASLYGIGR